MPQLDPSIFVPQVVWLLITFAVMYLIMAKVATPRISDVLSNRNQRIDSDLADAEQLKKDAEAAHENYERALSEAKAKAHQIAQETRDRLAAETEKMRADMDARLAEQTQAAEDRINTAKAEALGNVREVAGDAAAAVVERLTGQKPADAAVNAAVDAAMQMRQDAKEAA